MSLYSLGRLARQRDFGEPMTVVGRPMAQQATVQFTPQSAMETLAALIPSEALALYTAMVGVVIAEIAGGAPKAQYMALRWALFGGFLLLVPLYLFIDYRRGGKKTRFAPWVEMMSAFTAFAAWGLAMPGSPLHAVLTGAAERITAGLIVLGAVAALSFMGSRLKQQAAGTRQRMAAGRTQATVEENPQARPE